VDNSTVNVNTDDVFAREATVMAMIGTLVFLGATALALTVIWLSIAPQWRRIARLALGRIEQPFQPLEALARAERRIAVTRWASAPVVSPSRAVRMRVAA
jgi:hypothetical protein